MQSHVFIAILVAVIIFFILQNIDDNIADKKNEPRASNSKKALLFMFILIISIVLFYFLETSTGIFTIKKMNIPKIQLQNTGGNVATSLETNYSKLDLNAIEKNMLRSISEDIQTGAAPF